MLVALRGPLRLAAARAVSARPVLPVSTVQRLGLRLLATEVDISAAAIGRQEGDPDWQELDTTPVKRRAGEGDAKDFQLHVFAEKGDLAAVQGLLASGIDADLVSGGAWAVSVCCAARR